MRYDLETLERIDREWGTIAALGAIAEYNGLVQRLRSLMFRW